MEQNNKALWILLSVLTAVFLLGGAVLLFGDLDTQPDDLPAAETTVTGTTLTEPAESDTTASTAKTTVTETSETTGTTETTVTAEPALTPEESAYAQYITDTLLPRWKRAQTFTAADNDAHAGIAAAFVRDFRGTGTPDLLVIRLDKILESDAAAPVFMWYTLRDGEVAKLDEFECKMNWCEFAIRTDGGRLYLSGDYGGIDFDPHAWIFTELAVVMQPEGDLILENMQQNYINNRPSALYPADSELLLEMQLSSTDAAYPAARQYLLLEYSDLDRLLEPQT